MYLSYITQSWLRNMGLTTSSYPGHSGPVFSGQRSLHWRSIAWVWTHRDPKVRRRRRCHRGRKHGKSNTSELPHFLRQMCHINYKLSLLSNLSLQYSIMWKKFKIHWFSYDFISILKQYESKYRDITRALNHNMKWLDTHKRKMLVSRVAVFYKIIINNFSWNQNVFSKIIKPTKWCAHVLSKSHRLSINWSCWYIT